MPDRALTRRVREYIKENWDKSTHSTEEYGEPGLIPLPHPFSSPCISGNGSFQTLFYWDTYFINVGLIADGRIAQAINNVENFRYLIEKYGFMPNTNLEVALSRSQPPLYALSVEDIFQETGDADFIERHFPALEKEYRFWSERRTTATGLNRYGCNCGEEEREVFWRYVADRLKLDLGNPSEFTVNGESFLGEAESGWDFSRRFEMKSREFLPVDLNALLYQFECLLSKYASLLGEEQKSEDYLQSAKLRKERMDKLLYCAETGCYLDKNHVTGTFSPIISCASFLPAFCGISGDREGLRSLLERMETEFGIAATGRDSAPSKTVFQWEYPNMWPCLVFFAVKALFRAGMKEDGDRLCEKYIDTVNREFLLSGSLWEKYDAVTGRYSSVNEYHITKMLGWTAGVYNYCMDTLNLL